MELLELLKYRYEIAKSWTKKEYHDEVQKALDTYECNRSDEEVFALLLNPNKRYEFTIPYVFATHESMLSSMFDRIPALVIKKRGKFDDDKKNKIESAYEYLTDKLDLESFMTEAAWWFILTGFVSAHGSFKSEIEEVPMTGDFGEPMLDEMTGEPLTMANYVSDDPEIKVGVPFEEFYSPESKFSNDATKVPFYIREEMMTVDEVKRVYGKDVEADTEIKVESKREARDDIKRVNVKFYYGQLSKDQAEEKDSKGNLYIEGWSEGKDVFVVYTNKEILYGEVVGKKNCRLGKWHGRPDKFFGFGIGKTLREVQIEMSIRRGQQIRYADIAAFPKIAADVTSEFDMKAIQDPREMPVLLYRDKAPEYLTAPDLSNTLIITEEKAREDAQFISGMLDLSKGAQDSQVVKTATGQSIFAEAAEKRIKQMKRQFGRFYREVVIMILELARDNWQEEKIASITDDSGVTVDLSITPEDLKDIDFDLDLDIDMESVSVNKEVLRAQAIELYNVMKDDPNINRAEVAQKVLRDGFNESDPKKYILQNDPNNPMGGQLPMEGAPSPQGTVPMSNAGVMGAGNGTGI